MLEEKSEAVENTYEFELDTQADEELVLESGENDYIDEDGQKAHTENDGGQSNSAELLEEIEHLRSEINSLKNDISRREAEFERMNSECHEFSMLFPDVSLKNVSDSVWEQVKKGMPLSAAYAYEERKRNLEKMRSQSINARNSEKSTGRLVGDDNGGYFSPSEVKAMDRNQIKANYSKIIDSMSHWN